MKLLTVGILQTYRSCNPSFRYLSSANPRRVITKPSQGISNNNYDNINSDLIFYVNDVLGLQQKHKYVSLFYFSWSWPEVIFFFSFRTTFCRYLVLDLLGQGTFGQVVKCKRLDTGELVAVKAVKNRPAYFNQGMFEVHVLELVCVSRYWLARVWPLTCFTHFSLIHVSILINTTLCSLKTISSTVSIFVLSLNCWVWTCSTLSSKISIVAFQRIWFVSSYVKYWRLCDHFRTVGSYIVIWSRRTYSCESK